MNHRLPGIFVAAGLTLACLALPLRLSGDKIKAGTYSLVLGKGPVPSFAKMEIKPGTPPDWTVAGIYRNGRVSLDIKGKLANANGALTGKATPSNGYSGQGCIVEGLWGHDRLTVKLGAPYESRFECRYQPTK